MADADGESSTHARTSSLREPFLSEPSAYRPPTTTKSMSVALPDES